MPSPAQYIRRIAREQLAFATLRPGQLESVQSLISGRDTLCVMSTKAGAPRPVIMRMMSGLFGGVETGGTWCVCALGTGPDEIVAHGQFATGEPDETLEQIIAFFEHDERPRPQAIGIGSFGPVELDRDSPTWGYVTRTPKPGWSNTSVGRFIADRLAVPVAFDTDVNAAALGEYRWGAGRGLRSLCYLTVGTGIGGGLLVDGRPHNGLIHPEVGHLRIPHDRARDPFDGVCPVHGDCWEGLASGQAIAVRWNCDPADLPDDHPAWALEADYLALGIFSIVCVASPQRIIAGGGVLERAGLRRRTAHRLRDLNGGYLQTRMLKDDVESYVVAPALADRAGVLGALALARSAVPGSA